MNQVENRNKSNKTNQALRYITSRPTQTFHEWIAVSPHMAENSTPFSQ
jgi:hypothetical protein